MKFQCNLCSHVYDEKKESIEWESLPEEQVCPICGNTVENDLPETCPICNAPGSKFTEVV